MSPDELTLEIKKQAQIIGFDHIGLAPAAPIQNSARLQAWLDSGYQASMTWMTTHLEKRLEPARLMPGAKSIIVVALNYYTPQPFSADPARGRISRYARGKDYHHVLKQKLKNLLGEIKKMDADVTGRYFVDTALVLEKFWAVQAGIGWQGKHSIVITRRHGSWVFLGVLILNAALSYDRPAKAHCGSCRRCMEACPTQAIVKPYVVDARKCIAYWTIEHRGEMHPEIAARLGNWVFGCDICQEVCPWNIKFATPTNENAFLPASILTSTKESASTLDPLLSDLLTISEDEFDRRFQDSPIQRATWEGMKRNTTVAHSNSIT